MFKPSMASGNFGWPSFGSTFSGATPPSWLGGLAQYASPEEWRTQGSAFILNPSILEQRYKFAQIGKETAEEKANRPILERQAQIQREQADIASRMFNPVTYADNLRRQQEMERQKMDYEMKQLDFRSRALDWKESMMERFGFRKRPEPRPSPETAWRNKMESATRALFPNQNRLNYEASPQSNWNTNYRVPVFPS